MNLYLQSLIRLLGLYLITISTSQFASLAFGLIYIYIYICFNLLIYTYTISYIRMGLPSGLFPSGFSTKTLYMPLLSPHTRYMTRPSHSPQFHHLKNIGCAVQMLTTVRRTNVCCAKYSHRKPRTRTVETLGQIIKICRI